MSNPRPRRQGRRGSAVGLLNVDDEAVYGENVQKHGKKKGSLLSRVKKNVGKKMEGAAEITKTSLSGGVQMLVSKSGHYSAEKEQDSDEWESDAEFESNDSFDNDQDYSADDQPNQNSSFHDQSFDPFAESTGESKQLDISQHSFFDDDGSEQFVVRSAVKSMGIKARSEEGSKAKAERRRSNSIDKNEITEEKRKSNDNLLSRRLEDKNLTKIKYGDDPSILQFSPWTQPAAPATDEFQSEPFSVASSEKVANGIDPVSKSEEFTLGADDSGNNKKKDATRKKIRRNKSMPSEKVMRRAQRRSLESGQATEDHNAGRSTRNPRTHRRTKSSDDAPFDMSDQVDVETKKKRNARSSPKRSNNSSSHERTLSTSGHGRSLSRSAHSSRALNASSHHKPRKSKGETSNRKSATTPTDITQQTSLDVRF